MAGRGKKKLELCEKYIVNKDCPGDCNKLHICRAYILNDACRMETRRSGCRQDHDLSTPHNLQTLTGASIPDLAPAIAGLLDDDMFAVMLVREHLKKNRNPYTVPLICQPYNTNQGCFEPGRCNHLHLCRALIIGDCDADMCSYSHDAFNNRNRMLLEEYGIDVNSTETALSELRLWTHRLGTLRSRKGSRQLDHSQHARDDSIDRLSEGSIDSNISRSRNDRGRGRGRGGFRGGFRGGGRGGRGRYTPRPSKEQDEPARSGEILNRAHSSHHINYENPEICTDYLKGSCSTKACGKIHDRYKLPFSWQHRPVSESHWKFFDAISIQKLQNAYTVVERDSCSASVKVDGRISSVDVKFSTMSFILGSVQYSVRYVGTINKCQAPTNPYATQWVWYRSSGAYWLDLSSQLALNQLEKKYISEPYGSYTYSFESGVNCTIDFQSMTILSGNGAEMCQVRRRPKATSVELTVKEMHVNNSHQPRNRQDSGDSKSGNKKGNAPKEKQSEAPWICLGFLTSTCTKERQCPQFHSKHSYEWQYKDGKTWVCFTGDHKQIIEDSFCDVEKTSVELPEAAEEESSDSSNSTVLDFTTMRLTKPSGAYPVRRLSTPSATRKNNTPHHMTWCWYRYVKNAWVQYNKDGFIKSERLEEQYQAKHGRGAYNIMVDDIEYTVSFDAMKQTNVTEGTEYPVRRRPASKAHKAMENTGHVCVEYLAGECKKYKDCGNIHSTQPFVWQNKINSTTWTTFDKEVNIALERAYCNVEKTSVSFTLGTENKKWTLEFHPMRAMSPTKGIFSIRRMCTPSKYEIDVSKLSVKLHKYLTVWNWYQSRDQRRWETARTYEKDQAGAISAIMEQRYIMNKSEPMVFMRGSEIHEIDFNSMCETDFDSKKLEFHFRRRPVFNESLVEQVTKRTTTVSDEVCVEFLASHCTKDRECSKFHCVKPYQWRYQIRESEWRHFDPKSNEILEQAFCDPINKSCSTVLSYIEGSQEYQLNFTVDFSDMTASTSATSLSLKRLSTPSSVTAATTRAQTTQNHTKWKWYWPENDGRWIEFSGGVASEILERYYQKNPAANISYTIGRNSYELNLANMTQRNTHYTTVREVRRRPASREAALSSSMSSSVLTRPSYWCESGHAYQKTDIYELHLLPTTSQEYVKISRLFGITMASNPVRQILRIQNLDLWDNYARKKNKMAAASGKDPREELLFHGTRQQYKDVICKQGFDWRVAGMSSGTAFGKGSYFARDASYSSGYTDSRSMFVVQILCGDVTKGSSELVRPPPKDPSRPLENFYDSVVDNVTNPGIYVIFDISQAYPAYIIEY